MLGPLAKWVITLEAILIFDLVLPPYLLDSSLFHMGNKIRQSLLSCFAVGWQKINCTSEAQDTFWQ